MSRVQIVAGDARRLIVSEGVSRFQGLEDNPVFGAFGYRYFPSVFGERCRDLSFSVSLDDIPALLVECDVTDGILARYGQPMQIIYADDLTGEAKATALRFAFKQLDKYGRERRVSRVLIAEPTPRNMLSGLGRACLARSAEYWLRIDALIDLSLSEATLYRDVRKSFKSLINWGRQHMTMEHVNGEHPHRDRFDAYRRLHASVADTSRSDASWDEQFSTLCAGGGELLLGYLDGDLVAGALIVDGEQRAVYASGAYDRSRFEQPISHWPVYSAILRSRARGVSICDLGEIPAHGRASEKYCRVGHFKKGFTSRLVPRLIWQYEPEAAR